MAKLELSVKRQAFVKKAEEYYNALRTNIQLSGDKLKVIAISSVRPGEGKSTTSINIAWAFARAGYKTLLVDADIRNSVMSGDLMSREKSDKFETMIETLRKYFDYIIVDTAPIGVVIDAAIIAQKCDASILVTEASVTKRREVQKAKTQLEQTGTPFLGVILNKFNIHLEKYGSYGSYGSYGAYGKK